jgi:hypothetical protein
VAGATLMAVRSARPAGNPPAANPTELTIRSAKLVIHDLANEWDAQHYGSQPFEFCGEKHLSQSQVKVCAENFITMVAKDQGSDEKAWGFPELKAYSKCMLAKNIWQVRACIGVVTKNLSSDSLMDLQKRGTVPNSDQLSKKAEKAIEHAIPDAAVSGVNGGVNGDLAERATAAYMANHAMREPPAGEAPGCEMLGVDGCELNGGIDPSVKAHALSHLLTQEG